MAYQPNNPNGQSTSANSAPVVVASDQSAIPVSDGGGSLTVDGSVSISGTAAVSLASAPLPTNAATESTLSTLSGKVPANLTVTATRLLVDGSGVTQPVSLASSPLPTGAATSAKQPALGTAGSASSDVITVQGIASMTALKVDGSAVTQPVSGTVTANAGTGTFAVSASSLPLPSGAATSAKQPALGTAGTPSSDVLTVQGAASMTALKVDGSAVTQPVSGTVSAAQSGTWSVRLTDGTDTADVLALTNSKPLATALVDASGNQITSFGGGTQYTEGDVDSSITGTAMLWEDTSDTLRAVSAAKPLPVNIVSGSSSGTQYTEDVAAAADPVGTMAMAVRADTLAAVTSADGDNIALRSTNKGEFYVKHSDSIAVTDNGGSLTVDGSVSITGTVAVTDNSGSLTVDNSGTFAVQVSSALPAGSNSIGSVSVDTTSIAKAEDAASANADIGVPAMAIRKATPANTSGTDGDYEMLQMSAGRLWTSATVDAALPAGTNAIGSVVPLPSITVGTTAPVASTALGDVLLVKSGATKLITVTGYSSHTSSLFIQVWNQTSTTVFSGTPICTFVVPPTSNFSLDFGLYGLFLGNGCVLANSSAATSRTAVASTCFFTATFV